ncbi:MAG: replication-associated recombination protein A [Lentisphaeraceae bacterium]|nr:replication-associated recombination protein A [Lentisphaeraceae bacterium]
MESLFDHSQTANSSNSAVPLAARIRPQNLDEFIGQGHILKPGSLLRRAIEADCFTSIIFTGPPGVGKTSLAGIIASSTSSEFISLSALSASVADVRESIKKAIENRRFSGKKTVLFIDELHRFNKAQQDSLLKDIENGNIRFIGATTHNPQFYIIPPLVSRSQVFNLESLDESDIAALLTRAVTHEKGFIDKNVVLAEDATKFLSSICEGDARKALGALELAVLTTEEDSSGKIEIDLEVAEQCIQKKAVNYDDDAHYDTASAFIKSMRGSDPDAAVYWLAKMLHAGEDIRFIARRIVIFASEDVGNADPRALMLATSAMHAVDFVGMPEARIVLSQAVTYCATAPKSNAAYKAVNEALVDVAQGRLKPVPMHLRDPHSSGYNPHGSDYVYPHNSKEGFVKQDYLGTSKKYYNPVDRGYEKQISERMQYWEGIRENGN